MGTVVGTDSTCATARVVVPSQPQTLRYVRDALSKAGYAPIVTADPAEVPRLMDEEAPRPVLLDLMLPGNDGITLMRDILDIADVPVIFLSVYGQDEVIARAFDMGAADSIVKPFSPTELAARIRATLRRRLPPDVAEPSEPHTPAARPAATSRRCAVRSAAPPARTPDRSPGSPAAGSPPAPPASRPPRRPSPPPPPDPSCSAGSSAAPSRPPLPSRRPGIQTTSLCTQRSTTRNSDSFYRKCARVSGAD